MHRAASSLRSLGSLAWISNSRLQLSRTHRKGWWRRYAAESLDRVVPSCPEWTLAKLVAHTGKVQRWATAIVERRSLEPVSPKELDRPPAGEAVVDWFALGAQRFEAVFREVGAEAAVWTWGAGATSAWWARRVMHETAVHLWDAQYATAHEEPIDAVIARDGIDEFFLNLSAHPGLSQTVSGNGQTIHLHCTDTAGEWLIALTPAGVVVTAEHAKGDVAVRGPVSDVLLYVIGRLSPERLDVYGDAALALHWQAIAKF